MVVIFDEFASALEYANKEMQDDIHVLASLGRPLGIHLVFATQNPFNLFFLFFYSILVRISR